MITPRVARQQSLLVLDVRPGEAIAIGEGGIVKVQLIRKSGQLAQLFVTAPSNVPVRKAPQDKKA